MYVKSMFLLEYRSSTSSSVSQRDSRPKPYKRNWCFFWIEHLLLWQQSMWKGYLKMWMVEFGYNNGFKRKIFSPLLLKCWKVVFKIRGGVPLSLPTGVLSGVPPLRRDEQTCPVCCGQLFFASLVSCKCKIICWLICFHCELLRY